MPNRFAIRFLFLGWDHVGPFEAAIWTFNPFVHVEVQKWNVTEIFFYFTYTFNFQKCISHNAIVCQISVIQENPFPVIPIQLPVGCGQLNLS